MWVAHIFAVSHALPNPRRGRVGLHYMRLSPVALRHDLQKRPITQACGSVGLRASFFPLSVLGSLRWPAGWQRRTVMNTGQLIARYQRPACISISASAGHLYTATSFGVHRSLIRVVGLKSKREFNSWPGSHLQVGMVTNGQMPIWHYTKPLRQTIRDSREKLAKVTMSRGYSFPHPEAPRIRKHEPVGFCPCHISHFFRRGGRRKTAFGSYISRHRLAKVSFMEYVRDFTMSQAGWWQSVRSRGATPADTL